MTKTKGDCMRDHGSNVPGMGKKPLPALVSPPPTAGLSSPSSPKFEILEFPRASPRILLAVQSQHLRHNLIPHRWRPHFLPPFLTLLCHTHRTLSRILTSGLSVQCLIIEPGRPSSYQTRHKPLPFGKQVF